MLMSLLIESISRFLTKDFTEMFPEPGRRNGFWCAQYFLQSAGIGGNEQLLSIDTAVQE